MLSITVQHFRAFWCANCRRVICNDAHLTAYRHAAGTQFLNQPDTTSGPVYNPPSSPASGSFGIRRGA